MLGRNTNLLLEISETVLLAALIFFGTRLLVQNFRVEGPSMTPTLENAEFLLVNKLAYLAGDPGRGDVVVLRSPRNSDEDLVKRVVALPDETVEIRAGQIYVNGRRLDEQAYQSAATSPDMPVRRVPPDAYFVLGDNRAQSRDSRHLGTVPRGAIVGQVWLVYWPPAGFGLLEVHAPGFEPAPQRVSQAGAAVAA